MESHAKLALAAILLSPLFVACEDTGAPQAPPPPQVSVATPVVRQITDWDEFTGRLAAVKSVDIRARVSGYLESVNFTEGNLSDHGRRILITFGAGHKYWFLEQLRQRSDVKLLDLRRYLPPTADTSSN